MKSEEKIKIIKDIKASERSGNHYEAFTMLNRISEPGDDFLLQLKYASIFKSLSERLPELKKLKVAVISNFTVIQFSDVLRYWLAKEGFIANIYVSQYNLEGTILDKSDSLYSFKPEITVILINHKYIKYEIAPGSSPKKINEYIKETVGHLTFLWRALKENTSSYIIQSNFDLPLYRVFGNYEGTALWGYVNILRALNLEMAKSVFSGVTLLDLDYISSVYGKRYWNDNRFWYHSKHAFSLDATGLVAFETSKIISSVKGLSKKCLVLDLDNMLWGGVIADDGIEGIRLGDGPEGEAFQDFQRYVLKLKKRGIIIAVCSKNEEELAKEPFLKHPYFQLKLDDITIFKANWNNKADNIKDIARDLNIGLDSIVFVDDNPAERNLIQSLLPMVSVPEMPEDPSDYINVLSGYNYFETISFSEEDNNRNRYYKDNIVRAEFQKKFDDLGTYLKSLKMESIVGEFNEFYLSRITQLINKTNQFNLTTKRYTEDEIRTIISDRSKCHRYFTLKDRFGDNGLIAAVILEKLSGSEIFIDTWVMSCRVLSRGMEEFIFQEIVDVVLKNGFKKILGKYIPTKKNKLVSGLYKRLGYAMLETDSGITTWSFSLGKSIPRRKFFIKKVFAVEKK